VPTAFVQEFDVGDNRSTINYDALNDELRERNAMNPPGLIVHTAGFTPDNVFRIFGVWESLDDLQRYLDDELMPLVQTLGTPENAPPPPDRQYTYELHDLWRGGK
jgi:hypothetical protein